MKRSLSRSLKSRQIDLHLLSISVIVTAGVPAAGGLDVAFVDSVTDSGVGLYTINLKDVAQRNLVPVAAAPVTAGNIATVVAVDKDSVLVKVTNAAGVAADDDVVVTLLYHECNRLF